MTSENTRGGESDANGRVLIVDDDTVTLLLLSHIARQNGWHTTEAVDLASARLIFRSACAASIPFDAVLSDYDLPDGSGLDLLDEVTATDTEGRRPLFLLVTGHQQRDEFNDDRIDRVDGFLVKPVASHDLANALSGGEWQAIAG